MQITRNTPTLYTSPSPIAGRTVIPLTWRPLMVLVALVASGCTDLQCLRHSDCPPKFKCDLGNCVRAAKAQHDAAVSEQPNHDDASVETSTDGGASIGSTAGN